MSATDNQESYTLGLICIYAEGGFTWVLKPNRIYCNEKLSVFFVRYFIKLHSS